MRKVWKQRACDEMCAMGWEMMRGVCERRSSGVFQCTTHMLEETKKAVRVPKWRKKKRKTSRIQMEERSE